MKIIESRIPGIKVLVPAKLGDPRGFFSETYNRKVLGEAGLELEFVQDNHTRSVQTGTIRGPHYQSPPFAQAKLVRVVRGPSSTWPWTCVVAHRRSASTSR